MIRIKLDKLLESHEMNISQLSEMSGLARSTITPLVNNPDEVKAIKIETINVLCDIFGIEISDLIEFVPENKKYSIVKTWSSDTKENQYFILMKKMLGNSERYILLYLNAQRIVLGEDSPDGYFHSDISVLGKDERKYIPKNIENEIKNLTFINKEVFLKDFKNQKREVQMIASRLILKYLLRLEPMIDYTVNAVTITWSDTPIFERIEFKFFIEGNTIYLDDDDLLLISDKIDKEKKIKFQYQDLEDNTK